MAEPTIAINHMSQCCEKLFPIDVISVDALTGISTTGDVIKGTGELNAKGTRHASTLPERMRYCKTWPHPTQKTAFPVAPGRAMPPVEGCQKQDYAVLIVIGVGVED
jgi:hypothetical protein